MPDTDHFSPRVAEALAPSCACTDEDLAIRARILARWSPDQIRELIASLQREES